MVIEKDLDDTNVIIKQEQPFLGVRVLLLQNFLGYIGRLLSSVLPVDLPEQHLRKDGGPRMGGVGRDDFIQFLVPLGLFGFRHDETLIYCCSNVLCK